MHNQKFAELLTLVANILDMKQVEWKPAAYRKAARSIEMLADDIGDIYQKKGLKGLKEIPGVGEKIAEKIAEFLKTGNVQEFERLQKSIPRGLYGVMRVQGMGPKKAWKLYRTLRIDSVKKLEQAAHKGKIKTLEGFGEKSEQDILKGLSLHRQGEERKLLGYVLPIAEHTKAQLEALPFVEHADIAGSLRRMKDTIKDIDLLAASDHPEKVMQFFTRMKNVKAVLAQGTTRSAVALREGVNCDLRVLDKKVYGAGLQYFSGSKDHAVALRTYAAKRGYKLSEYGLFRRQGKAEKFVCGKNEEEIYKALGMQYIPPEMRENQGELDAALKNTLPKIIAYDAVKGDLHMHTTWTDGAASTEEMVKAAVKMGYQYVAITDHSQSLRIAHGLDEKRLLKHVEEIHRVAKKYPEIHVLAGSEVDILPNGALDYRDEMLKKLDFVIAAVHSRLKSSKTDMTRRILKALDNPYVNVLAHPSGRLIHERLPYAFDVDRVIEKAVGRSIALEIDSQPHRLDLHDAHIRTVVEMRGKLCITTDSHAPEQLRFMRYGIGQARRGWAEEKDVINARPWKTFENFIAR